MKNTSYAKLQLICLLIFYLGSLSGEYFHLEPSSMVTDTKNISIKGMAYTYNPSITPYQGGYLLAFRCDAGPNWTPPYYVGVVKLNKSFTPISEPQILPIPACNSLDRVRNEDPRVITIDGENFIVYNEKRINGRQSYNEMRACKIQEFEGKFDVFDPLLLSRPESYPYSSQEKNWVPFEYEKGLLLSYTIEPHRVLTPDLETGQCTEFCRSSSNLNWNFGEIRGGTPAVMVDGYYLAFFHSSKTGSSSYTKEARTHYFMGAYLFSKDPPFKLKMISPSPIVGEHFYQKNETAPGNKHVVFPGGFTIEDDSIIIAYGTNDKAIYVATIDKKMLFNSLIGVE